MHQGNTRQKKMYVAPQGLLAQCFYGLLGLGAGLPLIEGRNSHKFSGNEVGISRNWVATHFLILQELHGICHGAAECASTVMRLDQREDSSSNCCARVVLQPFPKSAYISFAVTVPTVFVSFWWEGLVQGYFPSVGFN